MRNNNAKVSDPHKFITCSGDRFHIEYKPDVADDGTVILSESGKSDIRAYINSYRDTCDIDIIRQKLEAGDLSVLNQRKPMFGDFTSMPKTLAETLQLKLDLEQKFYQLEPSIRNKFDNDINKFYASYGSEDWANKLGLEFPVVKEPVEQSVSEVVSDAT